MAKLIVVSASVLFALTCSTSALELQTTSRRDFFANEVGKLAIFLDARTKDEAQNKERFHFFPQSGEYQVQRKLNNLWFAVNHVIRADVADDSDQGPKAYDPAFLSVQIINEYDSSLTPSAHVFLFRNQSWLRASDASFPPGPLSRGFGDRTIGEFFDFHKSDNESKLAEFDKRFAKWHGQVSADSDSTWKFRNNWAVYSDNISDHVQVKNYLIRFTPTQNVSTYKYIFFSARTANVKKMRIRTFAPTIPGSSDAFDNEVVITFN